MIASLKSLAVIKWYLLGVVLAVTSFVIKGAAEGNANRGMRMIATANLDFNDKVISENERDKVFKEARVFAKWTDTLRPISFLMLVASALCLTWSGFIGESVSKFFREMSIIVLIIATWMQFVIV